jgi:hypothetical protein
VITPGPWKVLSRIIVGADAEITGHVIAESCHAPLYPVPEEIESANFRLMAAAPDLLEACKKRVQYRDSMNWFTGEYDDCGFEGLSLPDVSHAIDDEIRAAIRTAEGE